MIEYLGHLMTTEARVCPDCGDPCYKDIEILNSETGEMMPVRMKAICGCEAARRKEEEKVFLAKERERRIKYLRDRYLPEVRLRGFTFQADDSPNTQASTMCRQYVDRWQTAKEKGYGLLLHGSVGTGKTFYAACIVNALIDQGIAAELTTITRLINTIAIEDRDVELAKLNRLPLIVLDDLGAERQTDYGREMAFTIIDERVKAKKPLIVTTNLSPAEMVKTENMGLVRTYERVLEACPIRVALTGRSRRMRDDKANVDKAMNDLFG